MFQNEEQMTILGRLNLCSSSRSEMSAFIFLDSNGFQLDAVSFRQLKERSLSIANELHKTIGSGERAILFFQPGLEFIYAFLGCLYAGIIAVPIPPPQGKRQLLRVNSIIDDASPQVILSTEAIRSHVAKIEQKEQILSNKHWIDIESCLTHSPNNFNLPILREDQVALLQYTSGSTSSPKGVMVTHGNLVHNELAIANGFEHNEETKIVGWLPFYHDMGLIGNILHPIFIGVTSVLMSPTTFLQNPFLWLQAISNYKGTTSGGPNFAYQLCVQRINKEALQNLDLSSWKIAFNGSEMIHMNTLEAFADHFSECGFKKNAFYPCYGLAESTLFAAGIKAGSLFRAIPQEDGEKKLPLISCGFCRLDQRVKIVDPQTKEETKTGEVWLRGPSIAAGYWNKPEITLETFNAFTRLGEGPFLRTGDIGTLNQGELCIIGRLKNLIIIRGKNFYPDDIESALQKCHPTLRNKLIAAFSITHRNEEKIVILCEIDHIKSRQLSQDEIIKSIQKTLAEEFFLEAYAIVLVKTGTIPRTTSGKVQYYLCREKFLTNTLTVESSWQDQDMNEEKVIQNDITEKLRTYCALLLKTNVKEIHLEHSLLSHGVDSLKAMCLMAFLKEQFGIQINLEDFFSELNIKDIVALIEKNEQATQISKELSVLPDDSFPLSFNQENLFTGLQINPKDVSYNIPIVLKFSGLFNKKSFEKALDKVSTKHSLLRTVFEYHPMGPKHKTLKQCSLSLRQICLEDLQQSLNDLIKDEAYRPFNLSTEPLFRTTIVNINENNTIILFTFHHLICDGWSMNLFVEDLRNAYKGNLELPIYLHPPTLIMSPGRKSIETILNIFNNNTFGRNIWVLIFLLCL